MAFTEEACAPIVLVGEEDDVPYEDRREDDDIFDDEEENKSTEKFFRYRPLSSMAGYTVFLNAYGRNCDERVVEGGQVSAIEAEDFIPLEVPVPETWNDLPSEAAENFHHRRCGRGFQRHCKAGFFGGGRTETTAGIMKWRGGVVNWRPMKMFPKEILETVHCDGVEGGGEERRNLLEEERLGKRRSLPEEEAEERLAMADLSRRDGFYGVNSAMGTVNNSVGINE